MRRLAILAATLAVAGCGGASYDGGRDRLPGPVPDDVTFAPVESTAVAPPIAMKLLDGTSLDVATLWRDRPVVVFFMASWCSRCGTQQEVFAPIIERYGDAVGFVGVAGRDKAEPLKRWVADHQVGYPVGTDPDLAIWRRYAVRTPPAVAVVAPGGKLMRGWPGGATSEELESALEAVVKD
ncbi:peroxiredoxin [Solirubrobacter pauli]|uniref:Peroxiredoxin n=1 Tax=Solirubrobacter pauli TaxID=166793 RepID=A0A660LF54_9ACTN|nr:redoxin domain-containing protein [Solirubrobacter pauli]RKQ92550.1 peroxiredoxin [Solirubrobacter pauli]